MATKAVRILFPGLTHGGKMYNIGDIEPNPDNYLLEAAHEKTKQLHRDSGKYKRLCKFVSLGAEVSDFDEFEDEAIEGEIERTPVFVDGGYDDDLDEKKRPELVLLVSSLGFQKAAAKSLKKPQLVNLIRFLRTL
jgi:hypothetical protein